MIRTIHATIPVSALIVIEDAESAIDNATKLALENLQHAVLDRLQPLNTDGVTYTIGKPKVTTKVDYGRGSEAHEPEAGTSGS